MSRNEELPPELKALEAELADLVPRDDGLDAARLMFLAGQAAAKPSATGYVWPTAFGGMTIVAATLAVLLMFRPEPEVVERTVRVPAAAAQVEKPLPETAVPTIPAVEAAGSPEPDREASPPALPYETPGFLASLFFGDYLGLDRPERWKTSYPGLRDRVLAQGLDSWPTVVSRGARRPPSPQLTHRELYEELLEESM